MFGEGTAYSVGIRSEPTRFGKRIRDDLEVKRCLRLRMGTVLQNINAYLDQMYSILIEDTEDIFVTDPKNFPPGDWSHGSQDQAHLHS